MNHRALLVLLSLLGYVQSAYVQELYRYKDDKGRWHFSDKKSTSAASQKKVEQFNINRINRIDLSHQYKDGIVDQDLCKPDEKRRSRYYQKRGGYIGKKGTFNISHDMANNNLARINAANGFFCTCRGATAIKPS